MGMENDIILYYIHKVCHFRTLSNSQKVGLILGVFLHDVGLVSTNRSQPILSDMWKTSHVT